LKVLKVWVSLLTSLFEKLAGEFELKRNNGTEFTARLTVTEKRTIIRASLAKFRFT
jgi:two-component sensor histidine kinase